MTKETLTSVVHGFGRAFNGGNDLITTKRLLADVDPASLTADVDTGRLAALTACMYGRIPVTAQLVFTMADQGDAGYRYVPANAYTLATVSALYAYVHGQAIPDPALAVADMTGAYVDLPRSLQRRVEEAQWHMTRFMTTAEAENFGAVMAAVQG